MGFDRIHPNISNPCRDDERGIDAAGFPAHNRAHGQSEEEEKGGAPHRIPETPCGKMFNWPRSHNSIPMTGSEPWLIKLSLYLSGLSQKCIVAGVKKWKETQDQQKAATDIKLIEEFELAKSIETKIEQQITVSIREVKLTPELIQEILSIETNPLIKSQLVEKFLLSDISPEYIEELFVSQNPVLQEHRDTLHLLGICWLDAMDKVLANNHQLQGIISFRGFRAMRRDMKNIEAGIVKANLSGEQAEKNAQSRQEELLAAISKIPGYGLSSSKDAEDSKPEHLKSQNQRRFDRAKKHLTDESVIDAEREFRGLIEDIEALKLDHDPDLLLLRSCLNLASSLWEQSRQNDAAIWFDKAYALNPNDWRAKRGRAFAFIFRNSIGEAITIFEEIRRIRPKESEHLCNLAWVLKNNGRVGEAIQLLETNPFDDVYYHSILAFSYARAERYEEAEKSARKALQREPGSEVAQTALSFAIGTPIIQKRVRRETVQFALSEEERSRLLEAISHAETAAVTLRKEGRLNVLFDVLSGLTAFYPAVGACEEAANTAKEALLITPNDATILRNLWCIQMRMFKFDAAAETAASLQGFDDFMEWWNKRCEALVSADRGQEVIDSWQASKNDPRFSANSNVIGIVARAFSRQHQTEQGLDLLNQNLQVKPEDPVLLLERAQLMEDLGHLDAARKDIDNAIQHAMQQKHILAQALVSKGMFHFRHGEWKDAAKIFQELGGEGIHNPLFPNFLICLFNQGEFRDSLNFAEKAIIETKEFVEDFYAIAARCHHICENFPRARALLEVLVAKSAAARELEHRKLLAWACWRMDDLPQTYDVVRKALKLNPNDLDCLILITAVCTLLGKHKQAVANGFNAVTAHPDSVRAHTAFVKAMFSWADSQKPEQKYIDAHFQSLQFLERHDPTILRAVPVEPDGHSLLAMVKARAEEVHKIEVRFKTQPLPMSLFARHVGRTIFTVWASLLRHKNIKVRMAFGPLEEQNAEVQNVASCDKISIDLIALLTLQHLNLLRLLPSMFKRIFVTPSILDEVVESLREIQRPGAAGTLTVENDRLVNQVIAEDDKKSVITFLTEIRDFIKGPHVQIVGLLPETVNTGMVKLLVDTCGMAGISPYLAAKERSIALYSDDACVRAIGRLDQNPKSFCTQAFLRVAVQRGLLSGTEYQDAVIKLIRSNYAFVSEDAGILKRCYDLAGGKITPLALDMINRINHPNYDQPSCLPLLAEFAVIVWRTKEPPGANTRGDWLREIWKAISKAKETDKRAMEFIGKLAVACSTQPAIMFGIINYELYRLPFFHYQKKNLAYLLDSAAQTMSRLTAKLHPFSSKLSEEWKEHADLNIILINQGFLQLPDESKVAPIAAMKSPKKKKRH